MSSSTAHPSQFPDITSAPKSTPAIPFLDLQAQFNELRTEIMAAIACLMESQHFILGREVEAFEKEVSAYIGSPASVGCASGSDALLLALMAAEVKHGDEVITTPFTFVATAGSIARLGAKPVFVDIDEMFNIDAEQIRNLITERTRAIIPVHLFGLMADMDPIRLLARKHDIVVIEDAAQAIGASYKGRAAGTVGDFGCFSFFPSKNLGGAGDGGLVTASSVASLDLVRVLRVHGSRTRYHYEVIGINSRLDALQAAILRVKLRHLQRWSDQRRENADAYRRLFAASCLDQHVELPRVPLSHVHVYNQFVIRCRQRDTLRKFLSARGVPTEIYYPLPLHLQTAFSYLGYRSGQFPNAERASREVLALPIYPELPFHNQEFIVDSIRDFYASAATKES